MKILVDLSNNGQLHKQSPFNFLSANPTKWSNTLNQFVGKLPKNYVWPFRGIGVQRVKRPVVLII